MDNLIKIAKLLVVVVLLGLFLPVIWNLVLAADEATDGDGIVLRANDPMNTGGRDAAIARFATSKKFARIELSLIAGTESRSFTDYVGTCLRWDPVSGMAYPQLEGSYDGKNWVPYRAGMRAPYVRFVLPAGAGDATIAVTRKPGASSCV